MEICALVMAGGEGKRFWPLSSKKRPKQFLSLIGERSMIRQTVDRILPLIPIENIFIVTVEGYAEETLKHIPELPEENLILEPEGKNTAPCIAYGTLRIMSRLEDAVTVVLPADHAIGDEESFSEVLRFAGDAALVKLANGEFPLITLGVEPSTPETGYGYIKGTDEVIASSGDHRALKVRRFTEKPDENTALGFLEEGGYYWNTGVFIWRNYSIMREFSSILPDWAGYFDGISNSLGTSNELSAVSAFYRSIGAGSIDKLVLEKSGSTLVIPVDFPWSDLGSWKALDEYLRREAGENIVRGEGISIDSSNCMIFGGERVVAIVGVEDIIVVDSGDGILVLDKNKSQDVRKVVEELNKSGKV